jgi:hypothetical protein
VFSSSKATGTGLSVQLYRVDGSTPTESPTVNVGFSGTTASGLDSQDFVSAAFAVGLSQSGVPVPLGSVNNLLDVNVKSFPSAPRIGIQEAEGAPLSIVTLIPGEVGKNEDSPSGSVSAGDALRDSLERYLASFEAPFPTEIDVTLVLESDAPCNFSFADADAFEIEFQESVAGFPSGAAKESLKFAGGRVEEQSVSVTVPGNAIVQLATVEVSQSFRQDRQITDSNGVSVEAELPSTGVYFDMNVFAASAIDRTAEQDALSVSGVGVVIASISRSTQVTLELQEDWQGRPSGKKLAEAEVDLTRAGEPSWYFVDLDSAVVLDSAVYWLVLKCAKGSAVWLAEAGDGKADVFVKPPETERWKKRHGLTGYGPMYRFLTNIASDEPEPAVSLYVGEFAVASTAQAIEGRQNVVVYDITSEMNQYLESQGETDPIDVPVTIESFLAGFATVYPPTVVFDLPQPA